MELLVGAVIPLDSVFSVPPSSAMNVSHALIVCHEPLLRLGLRQFLISEAGMKSCLEADSVGAAVGLISKHKPQLVVLAACSANGEVPRLIRDVRRCCADQRILVVGRPEERDLLHRVFESGALGYVTIQDDVAELRLAVASVLAGSLHISRLAAGGMTVHLESRFGGRGRALALDVLSDREMEVFECVGQKLGCKDIAHKLNISVKTVETHKQRIKTKLNLENGADLSRVAAGGAR